MSICSQLNCGMIVTAKITSVMLLIIQSALLDYIILQLDQSAPTMYGWPIVDTAVVLMWILAMALSHWYFRRPPELEVRGLKKASKVVMRELSFAHIYWVLYSVILVAKIQRAFEFRDRLSGEHPVLSVTTLKIVLSLAGVMFPLLVYSCDEEGHSVRYKFLLKQLGASASLDILDSVMILDILFTVYDDQPLYIAMENAINAFSCLCLLLPVIPLLALRIASTIAESGESKLLDLALVVNSVLYLVLVNLPLLCIRLVLWARRDIDVSTFLVKNLIAIVKGLMDIHQEIHIIRQWNRDIQHVNPQGDEASLINDANFQFI